MYTTDITLLHVFLHVHEATEPKYITRVQCAVLKDTSQEATFSDRRG